MLLLGNSPDKIEASINTFHANELARTLLHAAHKRVAKNPDNNMIEGTSEGVGVGNKDTTSYMKMNIKRPPKKPPRRGQSKGRCYDKVVDSRTKKKDDP
jgi:hypothetical protein